MEERKHEESAKHVLDFKCQEILPEAKKSIAMSPAPVQRTGIVGSQHLETKIVSMTPEKTTEPLHIKHKMEAVELPEKYRTLSEFFDRMICSMRLLTLCKKSPSFRNICTQVEILTGRKFSCRHLAQMKYILPEALQTTKILIYDEKTLCMKPELIVTLIFDCVEGHHDEQSNFTALCQLFASRLIDFFNTHPEGCEIPESVLPEPFNQISINISTDSLPMDSSSESQLTSIETGLLSSTHLYPSFCRRLSQKTGGAETEKTSLSASPLPLSSIKYDCMTNQDSESGQQKTYSTSSFKSCILTNPLLLSYSPRHINSSASENTPMKLASEAENLMIETPAQSTPKRSVPSDNKLKDISSQKWMACNVTKRSLDFSHLEGEDDCSSDEKTGNGDVPNIIPQTVETKRTSAEHSVTGSAAALQKVEENRCFTSKDYETNQNGLISHQHVSASLSDLVGLIHRIFQSVNYASITKEELVHKIIINNYDIVERREVEEQIECLEELVPDWICRKLAPSGDLLYNIKKVSDLNSVRERLIIM